MNLSHLPYLIVNSIALTLVFSPVIMHQAIAIPLVIATNLSDAEINRIASQITVRIEGPKGGSGVIVEKQENTYYILTNWHVVSQPGDYKVITSDGKNYSVYYHLITKVPGTDLAIVPFSSLAGYQVAKIDETETLKPGEILYVSGWPWGSNNARRILFSTKGDFHSYKTENQPEKILVYTNFVRAGMSGGPILNGFGQLVGVNRSVGLSDDKQAPDVISEGVSIATFSKWRDQTTLPTLPRFTAPSLTPDQTSNQAVKTNNSTNTNLPQNPQQIAYNSTSNFGLDRTLATGLGSITTVALATIANNNVMAACGSGDGNISVWNLSNAEGSRRILQGHTDAVNAIAFTSDGQILISGSDDKTIKLWNVISGEVLKTLTGHSESVSSIAISSDQKTLASGSWDQSIKIWDLTTGEMQKTLAGHSALVSALIFTPDGNTIISGSKDKTIKIWNRKTGQLKQTLTGHNLSVLSLAITPNGQTLFSSDGDGSIKVWNLATGTLTKTLTGHQDGVWSVVISPDGSTLISASWDRTLKVWDVASGNLKATLTGHKDYVNSVAISTDGKLLISGGWDGQINLWRSK